MLVKYSIFKARQKWYREKYLLSEHWKGLRKAKLKLNPCCEICGRKTRLDVHHLRYKNIYDVLISDLQTLCRSCHRKHHRSQKRKNFKKLLRDNKKFISGWYNGITSASKSDDQGSIP